MVAKSLTEAEYVAASSAASEAVWMKEFISEQDVVPSASRPLALYCDNTDAIALANSQLHTRTQSISSAAFTICVRMSEMET